MTRPNRNVAIIGGGIGAAQCALTLAQLGLEVSIITPFMDLDSRSAIKGNRSFTSQDLLRVRPLLLRTASHPQVSLYTNSRINNVARKVDKLVIKGSKYPRYVRQDLCTSCGRCAEACSIEIPFVYSGRWLTHSAIHKSLVGANSVPSAYSIDKKGIAPCTAKCPLNINVTGFISLLAKGKVDSALRLINEAAPLAGVLGRVCTHPCEDSCTRSEVDEPVFIKALHRYAADNTSDGIKYQRKAPAWSRREKIAIVGSGPAGLAASWELARRGYWPTIFESHAVIGGMMATGIPRFRLPREVREREVKAIEELGVEIRTGVTIGRDVTIPDLRERGYRAFFLAIGAHENIKLNIPGEDLEGVVDSISLLFELNLRVGASVGRNLVVIGGGNSAVDSARAARRRGKRNVTILYRRTTEEMTAVKEEIDEAIMEGITIEYLASPLEILGDGNRVKGVRCQRMELGEVAEDGRRIPVPIPGSEFVIEADHVVLAIGQRPNTAQLNKKNLEINSEDDTVKINPITLETNVRGIFAGGDCVTGSNSVVAAVAAGLRAAESIDRYLRGRALTKGRSLVEPQPVEVDIKERCVSPHKRAVMPLIPRSQRLGSFEETSTGLLPDVAEREAGRCVNCPLCSECRECEQACELDAVFHDDHTERVEVKADAIINFSFAGEGSGQRLSDWNINQDTTISLEGPGIYNVQVGYNTNLKDEMELASSMAMEVASNLDLEKDEHPADLKTRSYVEDKFDEPISEIGLSSLKIPHTGIILCGCGGSVSSVIDFEEVSKRLEALPNVDSVHQILQACTPEGAKQIVSHASTEQLNRIVVAACRCCNQDQICYSCTDRRIMCRQYLKQSLDPSSSTALDFVNIREQCAWVHKNESDNATHKAIDMICAIVDQDRASLSIVDQCYPIEQSVLIMGAGFCGLTAAKELADQGYSVNLIPVVDTEVNGGHYNKNYLARKDDLLKQLKKQDIRIRPLPDGINFNGSPGNYKTVLKYGSETICINAGAIILDIGETGDKKGSTFSTVLGQNLLGRILDLKDDIHSPQTIDPQLLRGINVGDTAGIFIVSSDATRAPEELAREGKAVAARVWIYLAGGTINPRDNAITIDSRLCRGCSECAFLCPYIEMKSSDSGTLCAHIEPTLCIGCGACVARCPTGAITQPYQDDNQLNVMLETLLGDTKIVSPSR
ncbi:FAD-dependent oxidoreductase [Chloroflexota bacterium]